MPWVSGAPEALCPYTKQRLIPHMKYGVCLMENYLEESFIPKPIKCGPVIPLMTGVTTDSWPWGWTSFWPSRAFLAQEAEDVPGVATQEVMGWGQSPTTQAQTLPSNTISRGGKQMTIITAPVTPQPPAPKIAGD